jgi:hypothetical protein
VSGKSVAEVVQAQLDAYNAKDLHRLLETYAPDAGQYTLQGECLALGSAALKERFASRFAEPDLHARLVSRTVVGNVVADLEVVTRNFPEGPGTLELLCLYEVSDGLIRRATFVTGAKTLCTR